MHQTRPKRACCGNITVLTRCLSNPWRACLQSAFGGGIPQGTAPAAASRRSHASWDPTDLHPFPRPPAAPLRQQSPADAAGGRRGAEHRVRFPGRRVCAGGARRRRGERAAPLSAAPVSSSCLQLICRAGGGMRGATGARYAGRPPHGPVHDTQSWKRPPRPRNPRGPAPPRALFAPAPPQNLSPFERRQLEMAKRREIMRAA